MKFNSEFWIASGAIAPVLMLACIVATSDTLQARGTFGPRTRHQSRGFGLTRWTYPLNALSLLIQSYVLFISLQSLASRSDSVAPKVVIYLELAGTLMLTMGSLLNVVLRVWAERFRARAVHEHGVRSPGE
jgi:hypothetical protein